jgi:hypothetical protein
VTRWLKLRILASPRPQRRRYGRRHHPNLKRRRPPQHRVDAFLAKWQRSLGRPDKAFPRRGVALEADAASRHGDPTCTSPQTRCKACCSGSGLSDVTNSSRNGERALLKLDFVLNQVFMTQYRRIHSPDARRPASRNPDASPTNRLRTPSTPPLDQATPSSATLATYYQVVTVVPTELAPTDKGVSFPRSADLDLHSPMRHLYRRPSTDSPPLPVSVPPALPCRRCFSPSSTYLSPPLGFPPPNATAASANLRALAGRSWHLSADSLRRPGFFDVSRRTLRLRGLPRCFGVEVLRRFTTYTPSWSPLAAPAPRRR